jgi:hypothetical protein
VESDKIQKALEACFLALSGGNTQEAEECIVRITEEVMRDPSNYVGQEFIRYILTRFLDTGREKEVEKIMLNTKISI